MAKLPRVFQNLFGRDGAQAHFGEFGSRAAGVPLVTKDPAVIQALNAFVNNGWLDAINVANKAPFLEDMNGLCFLMFYQLAQIFQDGVPVWDSSTPYYTGSVVRKDGTFEQYGSLVDNNVGNALPSQTSNGFWQFLNPPSVAPGVMADFGGSVAPFGWLLCDGSVVAQASYSALFAAIGGNWNTGGEGAGNFRLPDIRGRVAIGAGQGAGLTNRTLSQEFGEETHALSVPEIPAGLNVGDPGHSHSVGSGGETFFTLDLAAACNTASFGGTPVHCGGRPNTNSSPTGISVGGGGGAHNNMQPSAVVTKIIKF